jgi:hypothetical protein
MLEILALVVCIYVFLLWVRVFAWMERKMNGHNYGDLDV